MKFEYKLLSILWILLIVFSLANLYTYSTFSEYDLYGFTGSAFNKTINLLFRFGIIIGFLTLIVLIDDKLYENKKIENKLKKIFVKNKLYILLIIITFLSLSYIFAIFGIYISDIPLLNKIFLGKQDYNGFPSVHLGQHHGFSGWFLIIISIFALKINTIIHHNFLRIILGLIYCILLIYGIYLNIEDFTNEQIGKRTGIFLLPQFRYNFEWIISLIAVGISIFLLGFYERKRS